MTIAALALLAAVGAAAATPSSHPVRPSPAPTPTAPTPVVTDADLQELRARSLLFPVPAVSPASTRDTFDDRRGGARHEALDILAPRGAAVVAVDDGVVAKLFRSVPGGLTVYLFDGRRRFAYYYAHLDAYAAGIAEQRPVRRGEVIGYVGSTGNAAPAAPHLHFAIFELESTPRWWRGTAIDPYPLFAAP